VVGLPWNVVSFGAGENYSAAVTNDGELYMWGSNYNRVISAAGPGERILTPQLTVLPTPVSEVYCGGWHVVAVLRSDALLRHTDTSVLIIDTPTIATELNAPCEMQATDIPSPRKDAHHRLSPTKHRLAEHISRASSLSKTDLPEDDDRSSEDGAHVRRPRLQSVASEDTFSRAIDQFDLGDSAGSEALQAAMSHAPRSPVKPLPSEGPSMHTDSDIDAKATTDFISNERGHLLSRSGAKSSSRAPVVTRATSAAASRRKGASPPKPAKPKAKAVIELPPILQEPGRKPGFSSGSSWRK
jgi:hypothetical protein